MSQISEVIDLQNAIALLCTHTRLLVACDFDGTVSSLTEHYAEAALDPTARIALRKLSELPNTFVAVISGRSLSDLSDKFSQLEKVRLVGSHGHEFDIDKIQSLTQEQATLLASAEQLVQEAVRNSPGTRIETKPHGVVFHYHALSAPPQASIEALKRKLGELGSGMLREGKFILEYCLVLTNKGEALRRIQEQLNPTVTLFVGDDATDECAFKALDPSDISVKVGKGLTAARFRVSSTADAIQLLVQIAEQRTEWVNSIPSSPIERHLFLSDLRTMALVDHYGVLNWLCTPRLDGAPLFGALVGGPAAGQFSIQTGMQGRQDYLGNSLVGKTSFGTISITDFFDCSGGRTYQRAGRSDLIRIVEGTGEVSFEFAPKFNFGRVPTRLSKIEGGLRIDCGELRSVLASPCERWEITREGRHDVARLKLTLENERLPLSLLIGAASVPQPIRSFDKILSETSAFWGVWLSTLTLPSRYTELVARSALVLRGLCYGPTGAIAAAATTSLPETLGGMRNWDYRYCWPRDASLAANALLRLNASGPALRLLDWLLGVVFDSEQDRFLAPVFTVTGRPVPSEAEVPEAFGYRGSRPVRIGNLASEQLQLDALGPIAGLMLSLLQKGAALTTEHHQLAERLVDLVQSRWTMPDSGIWEVRGEQRHFVHSKVMCWYTVTCCLEVSRALGIERKDWFELARQIRAQIETDGFNHRLQSYVSAYDLHQPDAALLWIILAGFHPPNHPRSIGTLSFVKNALVHDQCVYRYHFDDALHGQEGEFIICRFWLIEALSMAGNRAEAEYLFDQLVSRFKPLGLLSEEWDQRRNCALGNFPQAYSHLGLINAACALDASTG